VLLSHSFTVPSLLLALPRTRKAPAFTFSDLITAPQWDLVGAALLASRVSLLNWGRSSRERVILVGIPVLRRGLPWFLGDCGRLLQIFAQLRRGIGSPEMNCGPPDQMPPATAPSRFLNLNWDQSMAAAGAAGEHLDPALSSMVSSPASNSTAAAASDGHALHGISPQPQYGGTPLSSPPKLNLSMMGQFHHYPPPQVGGAGAAGLPILENPMGHLDQFLADPGFAERAARFSSFDGRTGGGGYGGAVAGQFGLPDAGPVGALKELDLGNGRDESSGSDPASASPEMALKGPSDGNARKRKTRGKGKGKDGPVSTSAKDPTKVPAQFRSVCRSKSTRAVPSWNKRFHFLVCVAGRIQRETVQIRGREQRRRGKFRQGEGCAEQQREWWQETWEGQHVEASGGA
jgi:hypothetical protein